MNKKDIDFLRELNELFNKIPTIVPGGGGATITADIYIASATDLRIGRNFYMVALDSYMSEQVWRNIIKTRNDIDILESKELMNDYKESRINAVINLSKFIQMRSNENWCKPSLSKAYSDFA